MLWNEIFLSVAFLLIWSYTEQLLFGWLAVFSNDHNLSQFFYHLLLQKGDGNPPLIEFVSFRPSSNEVCETRPWGPFSVLFSWCLLWTSVVISLLKFNFVSLYVKKVESWICLRQTKHFCLQQTNAHSHLQNPLSLFPFRTKIFTNSTLVSLPTVLNKRNLTKKKHGRILSRKWHTYVSLWKISTYSPVL